MPESNLQIDAMRFLLRPQIVAVDNRKDELESITEGLRRLGLPCIPLLYDLVEGLKMPDPWSPDRLRIVFLDLNLNDTEITGGSVSSLAEPVKETLTILSPSGPYLIAFWTKHKEQVDGVMQHIAARDDAGTVPLPIKYVTVDKVPFLPIDGKEYDLTALRQAILSALTEHKVFLAMLAWESKMHGAAIRTTDRLHDLVAKRQPDGTALIVADLINVLKNVAMAAWGKESAKADPAAAISSGLGPLFLDNLDCILDDDDYRKVWEDALKEGKWKMGLPEPIPVNLNTHCRLDASAKEIRNKGAWLEFTAAAVGNPGLWNYYFGCTIETLQEEFINPGKAANASEIRASVALGLLECSAPCDVANNKAPLRRYILCARIPSSYDAWINWGEYPRRKKKHMGIYEELSQVIVDGQSCCLFINFRYVLSLPKDNPLLTPENVTSPFRLRSQCLADIAAKYAAHTTRPGTVGFETSDNS